MQSFGNVGAGRRGSTHEQHRDTHFSAGHVRLGDVRIGISGWRYAPWRGEFYPAGLPQRAELRFAASQVRTVEINGSFHSMQRSSAWKQWHDETPADFVYVRLHGDQELHAGGYGDAALEKRARPHPRLARRHAGRPCPHRVLEAGKARGAARPVLPFRQRHEGARAVRRASPRDPVRGCRRHRQILTREELP